MGQQSAILDATTAFAAVLQRARKAAGLSQEDLAFAAGVDRTFVSRLERGIRQPTITTLFALAAALGTTGTELIRQTEQTLRS